MSPVAGVIPLTTVACVQSYTQSIPSARSAKNLELGLTLLAVFRNTLILWLVLASAATLAQQRPSRPRNFNPLPYNQRVVAEGGELYAHTCTACHGVNGAKGERAPALAGKRDYLRSTDASIFEAIKNGIPGTGMPPSGLAPRDIWKIVAYIRSLRASAADSFVPGNVAHGEQIFWDKGKCGSCHMIDGRGGILGPDLSNIGGQRSLREIRDALTEPPLRIPRGYQPVELVTKEGWHVSGIIKNEDNFSLQLLDSHDDLRLFVRSDLRTIHYAKSSLMPADYDKTLTPVELQDLLAFLSHQASKDEGRVQKGAEGEL
jgi:cytochrome c oxidase cbb3-type subunit 3